MAVMKHESGMSPGRIAGGKYLVLQKIGAGSSGTVYQVKDLHLNKVWAMKYISGGAASSQRELIRLRALNHPRIPRIVDAFSLEQGTCIVMDLLEGRTLDHVLEEGGSAGIRKKDCIRWGIELCEALEYLHHLTPPVIYRDMKPGNILLRPDGSVMLLDFGTAEEEGTPGYASPEQMHGIPPDARSDIYSLGRTLYRLYQAAETSCENPGSRESICKKKGGLFAKRRYTAGKPACRILRRRDRHFLKVLEKACAASPAKRYPDAAAMKRALEQASLKAGFALFSNVSKSRPIVYLSASAAAVLLLSVCIMAAAWGNTAAASAVNGSGEMSAEKSGRTDEEKEADDESADSRMKKDDRTAETEHTKKEADRYEKLAEAVSKTNPQQALFYLEEACRMEEADGRKADCLDLEAKRFRILLGMSKQEIPDLEEQTEDCFQTLCRLDPEGQEPYLLYISHCYRDGQLEKAAGLFAEVSKMEGAENNPNYQSLKVKLRNAGVLQEEAGRHTDKEKR